MPDTQRPRAEPGATTTSYPHSPAGSAAAIVPPGADVPRVSGCVRVTVTPSPDWPYGRPVIEGWVPPGSGLAALVDLGSTTWADPDLTHRLAEAVAHASRVSVVGDHSGGVAAVVLALPAAIAEAHELDRAPVAAYADPWWSGVAA